MGENGYLGVVLLRKVPKYPYSPSFPPKPPNAPIYREKQNHMSIYESMTPEHQAYYLKHRTTLEQLKADAIASVPCQRSVYKMMYDCECGATVICKNLQFHFISAKHRTACGSLH